MKHADGTCLKCNAGDFDSGVTAGDTPAGFSTSEAAAARDQRCPEFKEKCADKVSAQRLSVSRSRLVTQRMNPFTKTRSR